MSGGTIKIRMIHEKCRNSIYPLSNISRFVVPDNKVFWHIDFPDYLPVQYTSKNLKGKDWADLEIEDTTFRPKWNDLDNGGKINRKSLISNYCIDHNKYPLNPYGRTGIIGRGLLGRWGPNHAADPIVTRWKKSTKSLIEVDSITKKPILEFVGIQRRDSGEWALPGGMIDPGEKVSHTLYREFMEEAMNSLEKNEHEIINAEKLFKEFFENGEEIYKGYVDDPRNTDNAWMETVAFNFHDDDGLIVGKMNLESGDDAKNVRWLEISNNLFLYASHKDFIKKVAEKHKAHW